MRTEQGSWTHDPMRLVQLLVPQRMRWSHQGTPAVLPLCPFLPDPVMSLTQHLPARACVFSLKAKAAQLDSWQCEECRANGVKPVQPTTEIDPREWVLKQDTVICCLPEVPPPLPHGERFKRV
jgi:hypothetical protein